MQRINHFYGGLPYHQKNRAQKITDITVEGQDMIIARVLIDNGSTLNICLVITLGEIRIKDTSIHSNGMMVLAFNGTKIKDLGEIDLKILIEPTNLNRVSCYQHLSSL